MGRMAGKTLPLPNGSVDDRLHHILQLRMAGVAEPGNVPLEQPLVAGEMGIVTGRAFPLYNGVVPELFLEGGAIMAGETIDGGLGRTTGAGQKKNSTGQNDANRAI
jgi:hypothetical protein